MLRGWWGWLPLVLLFGVLEWPYQLLSALGFQVQQRLWPWPQQGPAGVLLVFAATALLLLLAWGPLAAGRGGGLAPLLALERSPGGGEAQRQVLWLEMLSLRTQLLRLPLMLLTHLGGLAVGVESPAAALGASALLAIRRRWPRWGPLAALPLPLVAVIGGAAGLGVAFRSPLLAVAYGLEELGRRSGLPLVLPTLLLAAGGALLSTDLGQPARLSGWSVGAPAPGLWPQVLLITPVAALLGALFVRLLIPLAALLRAGFSRWKPWMIPLIAALLTLLALLSGGRSLNDGSLSLAAALQGQPAAPPLTLLWRWLASLLSIAAAAPGGLMHDAMTLGALLPAALGWLPGWSALSSDALAQLAAIGATALFSAANGTPIFCALFVFTLQGDPQLLTLLLLVSAVSAALAQPLRGQDWNDHQCEALLG